MNAPGTSRGTPPWTPPLILPAAPGARRRARRRFLAAIVILVAPLACGGDAAEPPGEARVPGPEAAVSWNRQVLSVAEAEDGFLTLKGLRTAAMVHLAMHDALSRFVGRYPPYLEPGAGDTEPPHEVDPLTAASHAAFTIAADQYPQQRELFEQELQRWLAAATAAGAGADDADAEAGLEAAAELGRRTARAVLAARQGDGWDSEATYRFHPMAPGVYAEFDEHSGTPEGFVFGAGWALARPFVLRAPDQFRSPPPPAIASDAYTEAYDEVKQVGAATSSERTDDQAHLAMWWKEFVESSHNRLARELVTEEELDLVDATRLFALLEMAIFDAYVNVFENKFHFNHWRPYTAIRWAENDGNPATVADPEWTNLHDHTYAFPSYPSAHGTACAAAMTVLADTFGEDRPFTMTTPEVDAAGPMSGKIAMDPPTRSFASFSDAAMECAMSRLYLGIHFRYDSTEGNRLGRRIGEYVLTHGLSAQDGP